MMKISPFSIRNKIFIQCPCSRQLCLFTVVYFYFRRSKTTHSFRGRQVWPTSSTCPQSLRCKGDDSALDLQDDTPWKSNHHFLKLAFRTTIILVGVYHLPKGTTIFKMVVDFQGQVQPEQSSPFSDVLSLFFFPVNMKNRLMRNWWFGSRWFGFLGSPPYERDCYYKGYP